MSVIRVQRLEFGGVKTRALELDPGPNAPAEGPSFVLIHGYSDSADCWRPVLAALGRRGRRGVAIDLPGFGEASRLQREQPILPQLDRVVAATIEREAERTGGPVIVAGNSLGGCESLRAAEREDLPIAGVVPVAPAGFDMARWFTAIEGAPLVQMVMRSPVPMPELLVRGSVGRVYRTLAFAHPGAADDSSVASFTRHVASKRDVTRILATGRRLRSELRDAFELERIKCPVMVVWGNRDVMALPSSTERIAERLPDARIEILDDVGHCPQVEVPERLTDLLVEFAAPVAITSSA